MAKWVFSIFCSYLIISVFFTSKIYAIQITDTITITEDSYVESSFPNIPAWDQRNLYVGYDLIYSKGITRTYFKFDYSKLSQLIQYDNNNLVSAKLHLFQYLSQSPYPYSLSLKSIETDWNQYDLTWNNQPSLGNTIGVFEIDNTIGWKEFDITDWLETGEISSENYGIALIASDELQEGGIMWSNSCQEPVTPPTCNPGEQPYLTIEYISNSPPIAGEITSPENGIVINTADVILAWSPANDPDNDTVNSTIIISRDADFNNIVLQEQNNTGRVQHTLSDGVYYFKVMYSDGYDISYSGTISFEVDTTPPQLPTLDSIPKIIDQPKLNVSWISENDSSYILCLSDNITFTNPTCTELLSTNQYRFENLTDGVTYFIKIKAQDLVGNETPWSDSYQFVVDMSTPVVNFLTVEHPYITAQNKLQIFSSKISDTTLASWELNIVKKSGELVHSVQGREPSIVYEYLADDEDGIYFAYVKAIDELGRSANSNTVSYVVDTIAPSLTLWSLPVDNSLQNTSKTSVYFECAPYENYNLTIDGNIVQNGLTQSTNYFQTNVSDGGHTIGIALKDQAGNSSSYVHYFTVDTTPPLSPVIELLSIQDQRFQIHLTGESHTIAELFINGKKIKQVPQENETSVIDTLYGFIDGDKYVVNVRLTDPAGNISLSSNTINLTIPASKQIGIGAGGLITVGRTKSESFISALNVKSVRNAQCELFIHTDLKVVSRLVCDVPAPAINYMETYLAERKDSIYTEIKGVTFTNLDIKITYFHCKEPTFLDIRTFFQCIDEVTEIEIQNVINPSNSMRLIKSNNIFVSKMISLERDRFFYKYTHYFADSNLSKGTFQLANYLYVNVKPKLWDNWISKYITGIKTEEFTIPVVQELQSHKYFKFPFKGIVEVSQWHGNTAYQKPHNGIDFAVVEKAIYAPAAGEIVYRAWDSYGGKCYQGGYGLLIEHPNGMYSAYFHLKDFSDGNNGTIQLNQSVTLMQRIGTTGNTGYYNCKPLGYHLHFELRTDRSSSTHTDPVPYIDINWDLIHTSNVVANPGRLTGDNPHPEY